MTKDGAGFIVAGVVVYILGSETQVGWLYLFDAIIWAIVLLSLFVPWWSLKSLRVERQVWLPRATNGSDDPVTPVEDGTVDVRVKVSNRGWLARYLIRVVETCPVDDPSNGPRAFVLSSLKPRSTVDFTYTPVCYRRGRYESAPVVLETTAPLGLFVRRRRFDLPFNLTVYPTHYTIEEMPSSREVLAEQGQRVKTTAAASEFYGSREYQYQDPLRHVHWRNTARRGQFVVKEFEETTQGSVLVAFEGRQEWGEGRETTFEYSIKIAASLAKHCGETGRGIGIMVPPRPLRTTNWMEAMKYLAGLEIGGTDSLDELTESAEAGQTVVAVVPASEPGLIPSLSNLATRDVQLVVVLLEGFADSEVPDRFASRLGSTNLTLVRCPRGNLEAAVDALGQTPVA